MEEKKDRLLAALENGMVMIHLDARRPGVVVPEQMREEAHLRLNLSYRFDPPDLSVGDWGVRSTLSFSGKRFKIAVPWSAVFAVSSHVNSERWVFPEDLPPELLENVQATGAQSRSTEPPADARAKRPRAALRDVSSREPEPETAPSDGAREPAEPPRAATEMPRAELRSARPLEQKEPEGGTAAQTPDGPRPEDEPPRRGHLRIVK